MLFRNLYSFNLTSVYLSNSILDDIEFYEKETIFTLSLLTKISLLLNKFTFQIISSINNGMCLLLESKSEIYLTINLENMIYKIGSDKSIFVNY